MAELSIGEKVRFSDEGLRVLKWRGRRGRGRVSWVSLNGEFIGVQVQRRSPAKVYRAEWLEPVDA